VVVVSAVTKLIGIVTMSSIAAIFAVVATVPVVGKVIEVVFEAISVIEKAPEVIKASAKVTLLAAVRVKTSAPANVIAFVARVVLSLTVRVFAFVRVITPVDAVRVIPLIDVAVAAPKTGATKVLADRVSVPVKLASVLDPSGRVKLHVLVEVKVIAKAPTVIRLEPATSVSVAAAGVRVSPLMDVAVATPRTGVTKVGVVL